MSTLNMCAHMVRPQSKRLLIEHGSGLELSKIPRSVGPPNEKAKAFSVRTDHAMNPEAENGTILQYPA